MSIRGLYVITDPHLIPNAELVSSVSAAIRGGARVVQYRDKHRADPYYKQRAKVLREVTRRLGAVFVVNDDPELALSVGADGVHVGRDDADLAVARRILGDRLIGVSCYNDIRFAQAAEAAGADYVAFGSFFPSTVKPGAVRAETDLLRQARSAISVPIVAIGGITAENGGSLLSAGADALAVINGVFGQDDVLSAAQRLSALFD